MPNQMPYGYMEPFGMNSLGPNATFNNNSGDISFIIGELQQRVTNLEKRVKALEEEKSTKQSYDYQTSMNMM